MAFYKYKLEEQNMQIFGLYIFFLILSKVV